MSPIGKTIFKNIIKRRADDISDDTEPFFSCADMNAVVPCQLQTEQEMHVRFVESNL